VQFVETDMGLMVDAKLIGMMGGFVPMEMVVEGTDMVCMFPCPLVCFG
jgi:hypothetical protein